ncbi:hypothetical protein Tco_1214355 [Tanacetum coccineum]
MEAKEEKKRLAEEEATKVALTNEYDFIHARINADKILAEELQKEERKKFTIKQRAKFLHDTIAAQRKFLAQQRSKAIRNKPPTRNQLRNQMMTYLKHVGRKKHSDLKTKTFEEIQVLYGRLKRQDQNFVAIRSAKDERQIKEMNKESKDPEKKRSKKRVVNKEDTAKVPAEQEVTEQMETEACRVCILELKDGTVIYMLVERKYPLSKELLQQMLDLGLEVDSGTASKRGQREGKALMVEEDIQVTHKTKEKIRQEEAGLEEAIKLQAQMDEEVAKQIHLDKMIAKRITEEEELS